MEENKNNKAEKKQRKLDNLIPFKPGQSGNPEGREKGIPNRATILRQVLEMNSVPPESILGNLKAMYPVFFKQKGEKWATEFLMTLRIAQKAMVEGDVQAYNTLMDGAYGKIRDNIKLDFPENLIDLIKNVTDKTQR